MDDMIKVTLIIIGTILGIALIALGGLFLYKYGKDHWGKPSYEVKYEVRYASEDEDFIYDPDKTMYKTNTECRMKINFNIMTNKEKATTDKLSPENGYYVTLRIDSLDEVIVTNNAGKQITPSEVDGKKVYNIPIRVELNKLPTPEEFIVIAFKSSIEADVQTIIEFDERFGRDAFITTISFRD